MWADWTSAISYIAASILFWSIYVLEWIHLVLLLYTFVVSCTWQHSYRRCFHRSFFVVSFLLTFTSPELGLFVLRNESYTNRVKSKKSVSILLPLLLTFTSPGLLNIFVLRKWIGHKPREVHEVCVHTLTPFAHILLLLDSLMCLFVLRNESDTNRSKSSKSVSILLPVYSHLLLLDSLICLSRKMNRTQTARSLCPYSYPFITHIYFSWTP